MTNVALYARISIDDKKVPATENQLKNLRELAAREGYTVVAEFKDDGISGYSGKTRPGFLDLVNGIQAGRFDVICAVAEDRFTRSTAENVGLQADCVRHGVKWHTLAGGKVDLSTASGGLLATIQGAIAEYESAVKAERIRRSVADRLAKGKDLGGPRPFGYEKDRVTLREPEAELLRTAYKMILDGQAVYAVAKMFTKAGVLRDRAPEGSWRPQTVRSILLRPRNAGRLVVKDVEYETDRIEAVVDWDTFSAVRSILENPARAPKRGPKPLRWAAMGTVRCGVCGNYLSLTGANKQGERLLRCAPDGRPIAYQGVRHVAMRADKLDEGLAIRVMFRLSGDMEEYKVATALPIAELRGRVAELIRQRDVAQELAFTPGANLPAAKKKLAKLGEQIDRAQTDLDSALSVDVVTVAIEQALVTARSHMNNDRGAYELEPWLLYWNGLPIEDQRALVRGVLPGARLMPYGDQNLYRIATDPLTEFQRGISSQRS